MNERRADMVRAVWNGTTIAESDDTVVVEGNHYFPRDTVDGALLRPSDTHTVCPWKGMASYYSLAVDGAENRDAAWYYPHPAGSGRDQGPDRLLEGRAGRLKRLRRRARTAG